MADDSAAVAFVLELGRVLHRYGTPSHRLEEALAVSCRALDLSAETFTTPTTIIMSFGAAHDLRTRMMRVEGGELDMAKLAEVDALADEVVAKRVSPEVGLRRLAEIQASKKTYGRAIEIPTHGVTAGAIAVFFGGSLADVGVAAAIGLMLGVLAQVAKRSTDQARVFELLGAAFAAFTAGLVSSVWHITPSLVTVAALIILLPGMGLTVAMTELATRNLIAGTARLMSAVIVLLELVVGVAIGERGAAAIVDVHQALPIPLPAWSQWIALLAAAVGVAIVVQTHPRAFGWIVAAAIVGYLGTRFGNVWLGDQMGVMVGAFAVSALGNLYARVLKRPAQVVQVPAILLLVPGSMGFRGMTSLLDRNTLSGVATVFAMFVVAIAIVAGVLISQAVVSPRRSL